MPLILKDGVQELLIESRGPDVDVRDRVTILDSLKQARRTDVSYSWHDKTNPELWLADAACGAVAGFLTGTEPQWHAARLHQGRLTPKNASAPAPTLGSSNWTFQGWPSGAFEFHPDQLRGLHHCNPSPLGLYPSPMTRNNSHLGHLWQG